VKQPCVAVLAVSALEDDHLILGHIFSHSNWALRSARNCRAALEAMRRQPVSVVICDRELPDGGWKDLLAALPDGANAPVLIVSSHSADDYLWAEVLNLGGGDVLAKPFEAKEVVWAVSMAWNDWRSRGGAFRAAEPQPALA
jgi:DNA-binding response OmpR family regulator